MITIDNICENVLTILFLCLGEVWKDGHFKRVILTSLAYSTFKYNIPIVWGHVTGAAGYDLCNIACTTDWVITKNLDIIKSKMTWLRDRLVSDRKFDYYGKVGYHRWYAWTSKLLSWFEPLWKMEGWYAWTSKLLSWFEPLWKMEGLTEKEVRSVFGQFYDSHNDRIKKLTIWDRWVQ